MVHNDQKGLKCDICHKKFATTSALTAHRKSVHDKLKPYKCDVCHKMLGSSGALNKHKMGVHEKLKPFECDMCDKKFTQANALKKHQINKHPVMKSTNDDTKPATKEEVIITSDFCEVLIKSDENDHDGKSDDPLDTAGINE